MRLVLLILVLIVWCAALWGQSLETNIDVYDFQNGLSHRNVYDIEQDSAGLLWIATVNGLNRFDGYRFRYVMPHDRRETQANPTVQDLLLQPDGRMVVASPNFISWMNPATGLSTTVKINPAEIARRQAWVPEAVALLDTTLWCLLQTEENGGHTLNYWNGQTLVPVLQLPDTRKRRPLEAWAGSLWMAGDGNSVWQLDAKGQRVAKLRIGRANAERHNLLVADMAVLNNQLYIALSDGQVYLLAAPDAALVSHHANASLPQMEDVTTLGLSSRGDVWLGGIGLLYQYDTWQQRWVDYDPPIRKATRNTCHYKRITEDRSGVMWLSSDFGAIKISQSRRLFQQYISGGSQYCSNVYCSTRGITEDDKGNIYVAHYHSIHQINPENGSSRPLFPNDDYFYEPFGLAYLDGYLYTGNGLRIRLANKQVDTLLAEFGIRDEGVVIADQNQQMLWMGYGHHLYRYTPGAASPLQREIFPDGTDSLPGTISFLVQSTIGQRLWIGTRDQGAYLYDAAARTLQPFPAAPNGRLPHPQVNGIAESAPGKVWFGTAQGLVGFDENTQKHTVVTVEKGLPNAFINGILPEGDSCLWVSTDNGLSRYRIGSGECMNYSAADGLSSNEFNRISCYRSRAGIFYFGGLDGVNAFSAGEQLLRYEQTRHATPLLLTGISYLSHSRDSMVRFEVATAHITEPITLAPGDEMLSLDVALLDYHHPEGHTFQHYLEGFEAEWGAPSANPEIRYTNLPPGQYTLHVRAKAGNNAWNAQELTLPIVVEPALHQRPWFWPALVLLGISVALAMMQYRYKMLQRRRTALEGLVNERTRELSEEKEKSEALLLNILPAGLAKELKENGSAKARRHEEVTVMFSDFKGFSRISGLLEPEDLVAEIDLCFRAFDEITERHQLEKIKTIGDAYLLVGGINGDAKAQAVAVVSAALEIQEFMAAIAVERQLHERHYFEARIGIHTGPLVAGIVGIKKFAYDIWGDTVNLASRMETNSETGRVNISATTFALVKDHFNCAPNGVFKEYSTSMEMFLVEGVKSS